MQQESVKYMLDSITSFVIIVSQKLLEIIETLEVGSKITQISNWQLDWF